MNRRSGGTGGDVIQPRPAQNGEIGSGQPASTAFSRSEIPQVIRHHTGHRRSVNEGGDEIQQPHLPHGQGL